MLKYTVKEKLSSLFGLISPPFICSSSSKWLWYKIRFIRWMEENIELVDNKKFGISSKSVLTGWKIKAECYTVRGMDLVSDFHRLGNI